MPKRWHGHAVHRLGLIAQAQDVRDDIVGPLAIEHDIGHRRMRRCEKSTAKKVSVKNIKCVDLSARDVAGAVVTYAEKNGVDHIIVESGGKTASSHLLIGSVSNDVVNKAHCPVTVVR